MGRVFMNRPPTEIVSGNKFLMLGGRFSSISPTALTHVTPFSARWAFPGDHTAAGEPGLTSASLPGTPADPGPAGPFEGPGAGCLHLGGFCGAPAFGLNNPPVQPCAPGTTPCLELKPAGRETVQYLKDYGGYR